MSAAVWGLILSLFLIGCATRRNPVTSQETPPPEATVARIPEQTVIQTLPPPPEWESAEPEEQKHLEKSLPVERKDPSQLLETAMEIYQEALTSWDHGELEETISALDRAYGLILEMELTPDSPLLQDKDNLRLLIARRIQEIYASQASAIGENHGSIPLDENKWVLNEIKSFQGKERNDFYAAYQRSGRYRNMILEELRKEGLPEELSWLPIIESWFKIRAYSRAAALGLWQFIASTGYRYGLKRDRFIDERMDPEKATSAAVKYLKELHSWFGDWTTALAAYNCGEARVRRVINVQREKYLDNFWDLYVMLPRETARFVPRFIATLLIINDPEKYGMALPQPDPPQEYDTITMQKPVKLSTLSANLGFAAETLADLNPELRYKSTPDQAYSLKVPRGSQERTLAAVNTLSRWIPPEATYTTHIVRRGETVSGIASRYRTSISAIARLNRLGRRYLIRPGQRLKVPSRYGGGYTASRSMSLTNEGNNLVYEVKRGDSLYRIANAFKTTIRNIKTLNNLRSDKLAIGQKLIIQKGSGSAFYTVKAGDTPYKIAQRFGMNLNTLLKLNGLSTRSKIYPGQKLRVASK